MGKTTIEWADYTFNPWRGGGKRFGQKWGKGQPRTHAKEAYWKQPLKWDAVAYWGRFRQCPECGWRGEVTSEEMDCPTKDCQCAGLDTFTCLPRVFCGSLCDWLDDEVPIEWLADLLALIHATPNLVWQLLTKRPQNWLIQMTALSLSVPLARDWLNGTPPQNVWMGTSVEDQTRADERIPELLKIPAKVRFLSCEPLLGPVSVCQWMFRKETAKQFPEHAEQRIHQIIVGGESGPHARPMQYEWAQSLMTQCKAANVPFFMKQGSKANWPDFKNFDLFPEDLQVRGFPYGH